MTGISTAFLKSARTIETRAIEPRERDNAFETVDQPSYGRQHRLDVDVQE